MSESHPTMLFLIRLWSPIVALPRIILSTIRTPLPTVTAWLIDTFGPITADGWTFALGWMYTSPEITHHYNNNINNNNNTNVRQTHQWFSVRRRLSAWVVCHFECDTIQGNVCSRRSLIRPFWFVSKSGHFGRRSICSLRFPVLTERQIRAKSSRPRRLIRIDSLVSPVSPCKSRRDTWKSPSSRRICNAIVDLVRRRKKNYQQNNKIIDWLRRTFKWRRFSADFSMFNVANSSRIPVTYTPQLIVLLTNVDGFST